MSNFNIYKEFMDLSETIATAIGYELSKDGYDPVGGVYEVKPDKPFLRADVMWNDGDRVALANNEPVTNYPLLQLMLMMPKGGQYNPSFKLLNDIDLVRPYLLEGEKLGEAIIKRMTISNQVSNGQTAFSSVQEATHVGHVITIFCTAQQ